MVVFTLRPKLVFAKVEFSTGYTKTHSLPSKILKVKTKTLTKCWNKGLYARSCLSIFPT